MHEQIVNVDPKTTRTKEGRSRGGNQTLGEGTILSEEKGRGARNSGLDEGVGVGL